MKTLVSETVTESVLKAVKKYIPEGHYRLFYFGSRVNGTATSRSDIDIGIESDHDIPLEVIFRIKDENNLWIKTIELRNQTSHTYNETVAEEIYQALPDILKLYQALLEKLKKSEG